MALYLLGIIEASSQTPQLENKYYTEIKYATTETDIRKKPLSCFVIRLCYDH